ncbi:DUF4332 domain-containing protein [Calycomorphotria hydatis]|nr:DUF4332 domain-containing protein [Calycomorphotria hydatis]
MSTLFNVLSAWKCKSTHHHLALDALLHLEHENAPRWQNLFLRHVEAYLEGAKAPDTDFKDFKNHVLHVRDNNWGGAPRAATKWYDKTVELLRTGDWADAVYAAGVLSHYYTDPLMPFHTAQSEEETQIHRAAEWSMTKSYPAFRELLDGPLGYPDVRMPAGDDWVEQMVIEGALVSNPYYETIIERYDFDKGKKNPPEGLDDELRECIAKCIGHATIGFARILDRAFDDAEGKPPWHDVTLVGMLSKMSIPIFWVTRRMAHAKERKIVTAMYNELRTEGRVDKTMPEDDRAVREAHAREVLKKPLEELDAKPLGPIGHRHGTPAKASAAPMKSSEFKPSSPPVVSEKPQPKPAPGRVTRHVEPKVESKPVEEKPAPPDLLKTPAPSKPAQKKIDPLDPFANFGDIGRIVDPTQDKQPAPIVDDPSPADDDALTEAILKDLPQLEEPDLPTASPFGKLDATAQPPAELLKDFGAPKQREEVAANEPKQSPEKVDEVPSSNLRFYLDRESPVVDAPSIGPKTAGRLEAVGINTVRDLLQANATGIAGRLNVDYITADVIRDWQSQARLCCRVPNLRGHDAQILVACGVVDPEDLCDLPPEDLLDLVAPFCSSPEGERILRSSKVPDLEEVTNWIDWAQAARPLKAA